MSPEVIGKIAAIIGRKNSGERTADIALSIGVPAFSLMMFLSILKKLGVHVEHGKHAARDEAYKEAASARLKNRWAALRAFEASQTEAFRHAAE